MRRNEISEIRRRFNVERNNITAMRCCYVNDKNEIVAIFSTLPELLPHEDAEKYMAILKRTLSGQPGRNLINIDYTSKQVMSSPEHKKLMELRDSELKDDEAVAAFFRTVKGCVSMEGAYLILLAYDAYDVPKRKRESDEEDSPAAGQDSEEVFRYIICSICPVKQTKSALTWMEEKNAFHEKLPDWVVASPVLGFLFPSFDDRATNIYRALHYTRDASQIQEDMMRQLFGLEAMPIAAVEQRETFSAILHETLGDECSMEVVQNVHDRLLTKIEENREKKSPLMPVVTADEVRDALEYSGVSADKAEEFERKVHSELGEGSLSAQNLMDTKHIDVKTPDVTIRVNPERGDLVETRVIDGTKYILIRAEDSVEVNGIEISL